MRQKLPYIGITGLMAPREVQSILSAFSKQSGRLLMVGVLASATTLRGATNRRQGRYPRIENARAIFSDHLHALNVFHYSTDSVRALPDQISQLVALGGPCLHGIQFNITWPPTRIIRACRDRFPHLRVILQIGRSAIERMERSPLRIARKVGEYYTSVDDVVIDASCGKGVELLAGPTQEIVHAIHLLDAGIGVGVAGGLCADNLPLLAPIVQDYPGVSIDAESRLRNAADDSLDCTRARDYVLAALQFFQTKT